MEFWQMLIVQALSTAIVVLVVLAGFHRWVLRPYLDRKVKELVDAANDIEPRVTKGVKRGVAESLRELPESAAKESTRQFLRFGSELFENGLSSFLGSAADLQRRSSSRGGKPGSGEPGPGSGGTGRQG